MHLPLGEKKARTNAKSFKCKHSKRLHGQLCAVGAQSKFTNPLVKPKLPKSTHNQVHPNKSMTINTQRPNNVPSDWPRSEIVASIRAHHLNKSRVVSLREPSERRYAAVGDGVEIADDTDEEAAAAAAEEEDDEDEVDVDADGEISGLASTSALSSRMSSLGEVRTENVRSMLGTKRDRDECL
jgi:hypothetical protein